MTEARIHAFDIDSVGRWPRGPLVTTEYQGPRSRLVDL
jgi:hypothetical protein